MLELLIRSSAGAKVLGVVLFEDALHLREIARRAGITPAEAKRELDLFVRLGVLHSTKKGNLVLFNSNADCPFLAELRSLYLKTDGVASILKRELSKIGGIKYAFIFGSMASGEFRESSDIDLFLVGSASEDEVAGASQRAGHGTSRPINFILWSESDMRRKMREGGSFVHSLINGKKIWIMGDQDEFKRDVEAAGNRKDGAGSQVRRVAAQSRV